MNLAQNVAPAFVTPIVNYRWPDTGALNTTLESLILGLEADGPGVQKSNVGGWHSELDFLGLEAPPVQELRKRLDSFATALRERFSHPQGGTDTAPHRLEGWANVLRRGQYNSVHSHPNASWSMVYYVTGNDNVEAHPFSGKLELLDPRPGAALHYSEESRLGGRIMLNPMPGQIIAFPSWLQHLVHPVFSDSPRISVAVNLLP